MSFDWDEHYKRGGVSGDPADYTKGRAWKIGIVKKYCNLDTDLIYLKDKPKHLSVFKTTLYLLSV